MTPPPEHTWIRADRLDEKPKEAVELEDWQIKTAERLARIETLIEGLVEKIEDQTGSADRIDHLARIEHLEEWRQGINVKIAYVGGILVTLGSFASYIVSWAIDWLKIHLKIM